MLVGGSEVGARLESAYPAESDLAPDAGHESRAEGSRQPEKCPGNKTMSGSSPLDGLAAQHKERGSLSGVEWRFHQVPGLARWRTHSSGSDKIAL